MPIALAVAVLLAQAAHPAEPPRGEVQEQKPAPVPDSEKPRATGHGVTLGKQEAAPAAHEARQHPEGEGKPGEAHEEGGVAEHIFHHVADEVWVPLGFWIGAHHIDLSITKHVINMWIAAGILLLVLAAAVRRRAIVPKGGYNLLETFVVFVRDEIAEKNIGHHAPQYTPYLCSAFFFILFMNLTGLLPVPSIAGKFPGISTATGNLGVTVVLALFTFVITQIAGMRAQGALGYWTHLVPAGVPKWLFPIMVPVEVLGLFTKPFALTVRLFANMVAGHIVIYFLIALTVLISPLIAPVSVAFALGIYLLELFVALVQAYVFTMLSAVFIGMTQHAH
ncbi:MAG TPA: F0F1 ATP synthase subunit A [Myxococcales bacterium]|nr:F0F1 ATP synthase subunit A [Myxococcales bacterium]